MKIKIVKLAIKDRKMVLGEAASALGKALQGEEIFPHRGVSFQNIETLRRVLTEKRLEILHAVRQHSPDSVYQLAKLLNRDLKSVNTDIQILESLGFLSLETVTEERWKVKPKVEFDKLQVEIAI